MRSILLLVCLLSVLIASVAGAEPWTSQMGVYNHPTTWIDAVTTATNMGDHWTWTYALTPVNANHIRGLTITLGSAQVALVSNIINPTGWTSIVNTTEGTVSWSTLAGGAYTLDSTQAETFIYGFDHPWGQPQECDASMQDTYGYSGPVTGPAVPEPTSIMVCIMGLGSLAGFRKLRTK